MAVDLAERQHCAFTGIVSFVIDQVIRVPSKFLEHQQVIAAIDVDPVSFQNSSKLKYLTRDSRKTSSGSP